MSAATSGFDLPLQVTQLTEEDCGFEVGRRLQYVNKFCSAQKLFSEWQVTKVTDEFIEITPLQTLHFLDVRRLTRAQVRTHFRIIRRKIC